MAKSLRSICRRRIERGVILAERSWLKCDSKKIFVAAAISVVAIEGSQSRGASCRGKTSNREGGCSAVGSREREGEISTKLARCIVSADRGAPEETSDVGAVDWLNGERLSPGLSTLDGREGTSDMGVLGNVVVLGCWK